MNVKNLIKSLLTIAALTTFSEAQAGNQGVSLYYGASLGAMMVEEKTDLFDPDPAATGTVFIGLEEDGWALEYQGLRTAETATYYSDVDYEVAGSIVSLGYRTIEKNRQYYKLTFGKADTDVDVNLRGATAVFYNANALSASLDGNVYTLGWGMRLRSGERVELDYSYYDPRADADASDEIQNLSKVHILSLRYMFGGSPSPER
jgi:hypothetical protein